MVKPQQLLVWIPRDIERLDNNDFVSGLEYAGVPFLNVGLAENKSATSSL